MIENMRKTIKKRQMNRRRNIAMAVTSEKVRGKESKEEKSRIWKIKERKLENGTKSFM